MLLFKKSIVLKRTFSLWRPCESMIASPTQNFKIWSAQQLWIWRWNALFMSLFRKKLSIMVREGIMLTMKIIDCSAIIITESLQIFGVSIRKFLLYFQLHLSFSLLPESLQLNVVIRLCLNTAYFKINFKISSNVCTVTPKSFHTNSKEKQVSSLYMKTKHQHRETCL